MLIRTIALVVSIILTFVVVVMIASARVDRAHGALAAELLADAAAAPHPARPDLARLPEPVARYFERVLPDSGPLPASARLEQRGEMQQGGAWRTFTAVQHVTANPPGFVWDARILFAPGVVAHVVDLYHRGEGALQAHLLGIVPVANEEPSEELNHGELMRYLAEGPWLPSALLPREVLVWEATSETSARATLRHEGTTVAMEYFFDDAGDVMRVEGDRPRTLEGGGSEMRRWVGRFWNYAERGGLRIPLEGEVGWVMEDGLELYWRGRIEHITFDPS